MVLMSLGGGLILGLDAMKSVYILTRRCSSCGGLRCRRGRVFDTGEDETRVGGDDGRRGPVPDDATDEIPDDLNMSEDLGPLPIPDGSCLITEFDGFPAIGRVGAADGCILPAIGLTDIPDDCVGRSPEEESGAIPDEAICCIPDPGFRGGTGLGVRLGTLLFDAVDDDADGEFDTLEVRLELDEDGGAGIGFPFERSIFLRVNKRAF